MTAMKPSQVIFARRRPPPVRFGAAEELILRSLNRYHYLTAVQVCRLLSTKGGLGTLTKAQGKLKRLTAAGYLQRELLPAPGFTGRGAYCYSLATPGRRVLFSLGEEVRPRFRPQEARTHGLLFLPHTLAVNDVLLAAELLARLFPEQVRLDEVRHERDLKRTPIVVEVIVAGTQEQRRVLPDGWVDLALLVRQERRCLLVELDQGTERQAKWKRKVGDLIALITEDAIGQSPYTRHFGRRAVTVSIVTTAGQPRVRALRQWTGEVLREQGQGGLAEAFVFTSAAAATSSPREFYAGRHWYQPFGNTPQPLLALDREEGA